MKHRVWLDEQKEIMWVKFVGICDRQDVHTVCKECRTMANKNGDSPEKVILDLSAIESFPDEEVRDELVVEMCSAGFKRIGVLAARPEVRMVGMVIVELLAEHVSTKFFQEEAKALRWLG